MTTLFFILIAVFFGVNCLFSICLAGEEKKKFPTTPVKKGNVKWRIGYIEGGDYGEYHTNIDATIKGLITLGWIKEQKLPPLEGATGKSLWDFYSRHLESDYIELVPDGFYTSDWDPVKRKSIKAELISRLNGKKDLDLMIAMGTWSGIDMSRGDHQIPTIVLAVSDAVSSGIINDIHDSGNRFIHARVDPDRYERQVRIFHTITGFNTLGTIYRNDVEGRSYAAVDKVKKVARERGFTLQTCFLEASAALAEDEQRLIACFKQLTGTVDAIYVTSQKAVNPTTIPIMAAIAKQTKTPTFSQAGSNEVKAGLLLSISQVGFKYVGNFYAQTLAKILNGAMPGELNQIFEDPSKIAINLTTAEAIGFYPSLDILSSADEIYREIPPK